MHNLFRIRGQINGKDNVKGQCSVWMLICAYSILTSHWRIYDVTLWFLWRTYRRHMMSQLRHSYVAATSICPTSVTLHCDQFESHIVPRLCVTLWSDCESRYDQIANHTVTSLWIQWHLWRLWCKTGNLVSHEFHPLERQAWRSPA